MSKRHEAPEGASQINTISENINRHYNPKRCARCSANGGCKKRVFHFSYSYKAKICYMCCSKFTSGADAVKWLEQHAEYKNGLLIGFNKEVKE